MIRPRSWRTPSTYTRAAALLDVAGVAVWLLAVTNALSRHPWVFMLLGLAASVLEVGAIGLAMGPWSRMQRSRVLTVLLVLGAALPPVVILILAIFGRPSS